MEFARSSAPRWTRLQFLSPALRDLNGSSSGYSGFGRQGVFGVSCTMYRKKGGMAMATVQEKERLDALKDFGQATRRFYSAYDDLLATYPYEWIAVNKDGDVVANHHDRKDVIAACETAGYEKSRLAVKYLDPNPAVMIL